MLELMTLLAMLQATAIPDLKDWIGNQIFAVSVSAYLLVRMEMRLGKVERLQMLNVIRLRECLKLQEEDDRELLGE